MNNTAVLWENSVHHHFSDEYISTFVRVVTTVRWPISQWSTRGGPPPVMTGPRARCSRFKSGVFLSTIRNVERYVTTPTPSPHNFHFLQRGDSPVFYCLSFHRKSAVYFVMCAFILFPGMCELCVRLDVLCASKTWALPNPGRHRGELPHFPSPLHGTDGRNEVN